MNEAKYIKNQDDIQVVLHTVMFRGTPCISSESSAIKFSYVLDRILKHNY